ncbi:MAG: hypothetical protein IJH31_05465 [Erysipelotrichaceae bacterium]|nr:hypothetical protein [Erysipelotrichaceae bacterium]
MSIEEEIFGRYITDTKKLKEYGFKKQKNAFLYSYLLKEDDLNIEKALVRKEGLGTDCRNRNGHKRTIRRT